MAQKAQRSALASAGSNAYVPPPPPAQDDNNYPPLPLRQQAVAEAAAQPPRLPQKKEKDWSASASSSDPWHQPKEDVATELELKEEEQDAFPTELLEWLPLLMKYDLLEMKTDPTDLKDPEKVYYNFDHFNATYDKEHLEEDKKDYWQVRCVDVPTIEKELLIKRLRDAGKTTVFIKPLPPGVHFQAECIKILNDMGFGGLYTWVYAPVHNLCAEPCDRRLKGFATVDFAEASDAQKFKATIEKARIANGVECGVAIAWAKTQGYEALLNSIQNTRTNHDCVARECKPAIFRKFTKIPGRLRVRFPKPTKAVSKPNARKDKNCSASATSPGARN